MSEYSATKHRQLWQASKKYREAKRERARKYRNSPRGKEVRRIYAAYYRKTPSGQAAHIKALHRFIENHPFYNLHYLESRLNQARRCLSLDQIRCNNGKRAVSLYDLIDGKGVICF